MKTIRSVKDLAGKRVLVRAELNVPLIGNRVQNDQRILEALPTIKYLLQHRAKVILISHLGRPKKVEHALRLTPVAKHLAKLLGCPVRKMDVCIGTVVEKAVRNMREAQVILLENVRFYPEESACDLQFVKKLAALGDLYVNDAFGTAHRNHASTAGLARKLPAYAGLLLEKEIKALTPLLKHPVHPCVLVVGGAKVDTKMGILKKFIGIADSVIIGGAMANTFLKAQGYDIGDSLYEADRINAARSFIAAAEKAGMQVLLPEDAVVADEVTDYATALDLPLEDIEGHMKILDVGSLTLDHYIWTLKKAKRIIWNGPLGVYEFKPFANGTKRIAKAIAASKAKTYIGGGDTLDALARFRISRKHFSHVSTGGGAMLEFLEGNELPALAALVK